MWEDIKDFVYEYFHEENATNQVFNYLKLVIFVFIIFGIISLAFLSSWGVI